MSIRPCNMIGSDPTSISIYFDFVLPLTFRVRRVKKGSPEMQIARNTTSARNTTKEWCRARIARNSTFSGLHSAQQDFVSLVLNTNFVEFSRFDKNEFCFLEIRTQDCCFASNSNWSIRSHYLLLRYYLLVLRMKYYLMVWYI